MDDYPYVCPDCKNKDTDKCGWCGDNNNYEPKNMTLREENLIEIPEGATNGDMIKAIFPEATVHERSNYNYISIDDDVWLEDRNGEWVNSPYKKGGE